MVPKGKEIFFLFCLIFLLYLTGEARIRVQLSAVHDITDIDKCIQAFIDVGREKGVLK